MYKYNCLNPIAGVGLDLFSDEYTKVDELKDADAVLVRSAAMHDLELPDSLLAVARAGAGVNNIPLDKCADKGIVVFNTPGANANGVKELVFAGMLYAARDIVGGIDWCLENQNDENIAKTAEKQKKNFAGTEISGKKLGVIGLGAIGVLVANAATSLGMEVYGYDPYISVIAAGKIKKYVSDFPNTTTVGAKGCIVTPHLGASTAESEDNCAIMAVREIRDYLENGNIVHSVNFPDCNMGACTTAGRIGILHKNEKGIIAKFTTVLGDADVNVSDLTNKGKGDYAYSLIDVDSVVADDVVEKISELDGVLRVRVVK